MKQSVITCAPESWLFVDGATEFGGHEVMLLRLAEELRALGRVAPIILARAGTRLRTEAASFCTVGDLPDAAIVMRGSRRGASMLLAELRDVLCFVRAAWRLKPSLCVVAEGCLLAQPLFTLTARLIGRRVVVYVPLLEPSSKLGFGSGRLRDLLVRHFYANLPNAWITITPQQARDFASWADVRRPIFSLPNTVARHIDRLADTGVAASEEAGHGNLQRVLVLGRFDSHQKGLDELITHLAGQRDPPPELRVSFVGSGPFEPELRRRIAESETLAGWVSVQPWMNPVEALRQHDVLLIASRYEGVPLVMLEAMAIGVPVIATDLPGTRAFLPAQCLFPVGDLQRAFDIVAALRCEALCRQIVLWNRATYATRASARAFTASVYTLTSELSGLTGSRA